MFFFEVKIKSWTEYIPYIITKPRSVNNFSHNLATSYILYFRTNFQARTEG